MTVGLEQPVYALGGMQLEDMNDAQAAGAQGIAATTGYWS
jgi:thiamine monophosphate synthase